jgi:hypothetical protein
MRETIRGTLKPGQCVTIAGRRICNRWKKNASQAGKDYEDGIRNPRRSWGKATCEAQDCYKAGVDKAHIKDALRRGAIKAGGRKWLTKTLLKGPTRFAQGVLLAGDDYGAGFAPYREAIKRTPLQGRFPRGDPRNINRCSTLCTALGRAKAGKAITDRVTCPDR